MKVIYTDSEKREKIELDVKDKKILSLLCHNARTPLSEIARVSGLSRQTIEYRIRQMEKNELIAGSRTVVQVTKLGYSSYHFFLSIGSQDSEKKLLAKCMSSPHVHVYISYSGVYDVELGLMAKTPQAAQEIFSNLVEGLEITNHSIGILTNNLINRVLPGFEIPLKEQVHKNDSSFGKQLNGQREPAKIEERMDSIDYNLLQLIADNAQSSLQTIAAQLGNSPDAVKYRIRKLISRGIIQNFRPVINFSRLHLTTRTLLVKWNRKSVEDIKKFRQYLESFGDVLWCVEVLGEWDFLIYLVTEEQNMLHDLISGMKKVFERNLHSFQILHANNEYKYSYLAKAICSYLD